MQSFRGKLACLSITAGALIIASFQPTEHNVQRLKEDAGSPSFARPRSMAGLRNSAAAAARIPSLPHLPLTFEQNNGQIDPKVKFLAKGPGYNIFLTADGLTLSASHFTHTTGKSAAAQTDVEKLSFVGIKHGVTVSGAGKVPGKINYLIGKRSEWHTDVPLYRQVEYRGIYRGVDVKYYGNGSQLENDFTIAPHRDPSEISLALSGAGTAELSSSGEVLITMPSGARFELCKPKAYQFAGQQPKTVEVAYRLNGDRIGFAVGPYDRSRHLIIDPVVLFSTYLGGYTVSDVDVGAAANAVATDSSGNIYVAGMEEDTKFPVTTDAIDETTSDLYTRGITANFGLGFVTKFDPSGTTLVYSAVFVASVSSIAVDSTGDVYAAALNFESSFPTSPGAFQPKAPSTNGVSPLIFKLNSTATGFIYATYLGGSGQDVASGIAIDAAGNAYVTGTTSSNDFPTKNAFQPASAGGVKDGFVSKVNPTGTGLVYSTYLGGSDQDN